MSVFKRIARSFAHSGIRKSLQNSQRLRTPTTLTLAQNILLMFDGADAAQNADYLAFVAQYPDKNIQYFKYLGKGDTDAFGYSSKDTNFADMPKDAVYQRLKKIDADLLILFNPDDIPSLHQLAMAHRAPMKVSTPSIFETDVDLVFDRKGRDLNGYLIDLEQFMKNICIDHYD